MGTATYLIAKVTPYIPILLWSIAGALIAILILLLVRRAIRRRRYDRALVAAAREEENALPPSALNAEVKVIPQEELPADENSIFMPVPAVISDMVDFVREAREGVLIRSCVRVEDADEMLGDEEADGLRFVIYRDLTPSDDCAYVSVDTLSANFAPYSYVNLAILKKSGLADAAMTRLVIRADGVMRKPLFIEANEFSLTAVKMISLTGGRAVEVRPTEGNDR